MSRRRLELAALAALLAASGAVPALQHIAVAASAAACPTWTDPAGDASTDQAPNPTGLIGDNNLDIVSSTVTTTADSLTAVIKLVKLNATSSDAGDEFHLNFTAAGKKLQMYADRGAYIQVATLPGTAAGLYNFTDSVGGKDKATATYDVPASTVTITAKLADLATVAGAALKSVAVTDLLAGTQNYLTGAETGLTYDEAPTALPLTLGVACGGKKGTKPTPVPSPKPTPSTPPTSGGAPPVVADPTKDFPKAGCVTFADVKGDAQYQGFAPNDPDLDVTSLTLRTTSTALVAYIGVDKLAAGPMTTDSHRFSLDFGFNNHAFTLSASTSARGSSALRDAGANSGLIGHVVQLGVDVPSTTAVPPPTERGLKASGLTATFDTTSSRVVLVLPIADIEKYGMAKFTGKITAVNAKSSMDSNVLSFPVDASFKGGNTAASTDTWTINDNACFPKKKKK